MAENTFYFIRHAETEKNPDVPSYLWSLSQKGKERAISLAENDVLSDVDMIISSSENKAYETVLPLAGKIGKEIMRMPEFDEVKRGDGFFSKDEFETEKRKQLLDLSYGAFHGESGVEALARFKRGLEALSSGNRGKKILIASHGTILSIYFGKISGNKSNLMERWEKTNFGAYGIVKNGRVVKDIIQA